MEYKADSRMKQDAHKIYSQRIKKITQTKGTGKAEITFDNDDKETIYYVEQYDMDDMSLERTVWNEEEAQNQLDQYREQKDHRSQQFYKKEGRL